MKFIIVLLALLNKEILSITVESSVNTSLEVHSAVKLIMEVMRCQFTHWQIQQVSVTHAFLSSYMVV